MLSGSDVGDVTQMLKKQKTVLFPRSFLFSVPSLYLKQTKMQSMLNLRATHGVPLCLSGITNPLALSKEMADHARRRKAVRRQRSQVAREGLHANQEKGTHRNSERDFVEIKGEEEDGDLHDLSHAHLGLTAKAA